VKTCNTIFSKKVNVLKTFRISIVLVDDLPDRRQKLSKSVLERPIGIPLRVFLLVTGLDVNQDSSTFLFMEKTKLGVAAMSSSFDRDFPACRSKGLHKAKKENVIDFLRMLAADGTSRLSD
jgi:hypothetical protein